MHSFLVLAALSIAFLALWRYQNASKRAEEALRSSEAKMNAIVSSAMDAIISIDEKQRIIVFNRAAEGIFQCAASEALGSPLDRFLPPDHREAHREHIRKFGVTGVTTRSMQAPGVLTAMRSNGEEFPIEATISVSEAAGEKIYTIILRDVTERKHTEEALIRSEKLASVGRMAAAIAHEINNPLEAVMNALYLATTSLEQPELARRYLGLADDELKRVSHITRQTLGFYREAVAPSTVSISAILDSAVDLLRSKIRLKSARIEKRYQGEFHATAIPGELRQVFSNLLANSLDAIDEDGTVMLHVARSTSVSSRQSRIRITIADNGKGIDAATMPHIFEPLFTTKESTGSGLGLWVSKEIIEKHQGSICVRSSTNDKRRGTAFAVLIPAHAEQASQVLAAEAAH
jgi:PAS domain S-box-containing protein